MRGEDGGQRQRERDLQPSAGVLDPAERTIERGAAGRWLIDRPLLLAAAGRRALRERLPQRDLDRAFLVGERLQARTHTQTRGQRLRKLAGLEGRDEL